MQLNLYQVRAYARNIVSFCLFFFLHISCLPALYAQGAASFSISGDADSRAVDLGFSVYWANANFDNSRFYGENQTEFSGWTNWRRPHKNEIEELKDNCTYSRNADGYNYIATSNFNGAFINIPKSGYRSSSLDLTTDYSRRAYFWSDTQHTRWGLDHMMYCFCIEEDLDATVASYSRYVVMPIRLVIDKYTIAVTDGDISDSSPFPKGTAVTITANPDDCHTFVKWQKKNGETWQDVDGGINATLNITVSANAEYQAVFSLKTASITLTSDGNGTVDFDD